MSRFGETGLFVTAPIGSNVEHTGELHVFANDRDAMKNAADMCSRSKDYIVYELVERARVVLDSPRVVRPE